MITKNWIQNAAEEISDTSPTHAALWEIAKDGPAAHGMTDQDYAKSFLSLPAATQHVVTILLRHCPLEPDTLYMSVPRCETCRHWNKDDPSNPNTGLCDSETFRDLQPKEGFGYMWTDCNENTIRTDPDFGCVQWKAKS